MKTSDFYYDLPEELIAQTPVEPRDSSRMMVYNRKTKEVLHKHFYDVIDFLNEGDALIVNDSRVLPARIYGTKIPTGANVEFLLLKQVKDKVWETLVKPGKKARTGDSFTFGDGIMTGKVIDVLEDGNRIVEFKCDSNFYETLDKIGQMPLPPYIHEKLKDKERYQTVYSHELGSAAAPTAGLHFTDELLEKIKAKGIKIGYVTLHVGLGTFRPMDTEHVKDHDMHAEVCMMSKEAADTLNKAKAEGRRIFAIGTTSVRTLESVWNVYGKFEECSLETKLFIYPGYTYHTIDGMLTNFHLPKSTLIMMICALAGYENVMNAYKEAVKEQYRFFSFGDCMLLTNE